MFSRVYEHLIHYVSCHRVDLSEHKRSQVHLWRIHVMNEYEMERARYRKIKEQNQKRGLKGKCSLPKELHPQVLKKKKKDKNSEPQRLLLHTPAHAQWNRTPPLWRQTSHSVSIKWTQSHTSHSHLIYRCGRQASWVRHRISQPHSKTRLITLIHRKICEWTGEMIGKYSQAIRPQLENSHLPCWLSGLLWNEYHSKNPSMLCVQTQKAIN